MSLILMKCCALSIGAALGRYRLCFSSMSESHGVQNASGLKLEVAMKLNNLEQSELFWEKALDTKMLMAWNDTCMVLVFRGTASMANALADLQVCCVPTG